PDQGRDRGARLGTGRSRGARRYTRVRLPRYSPPRRQAVKFPHPLTLLCGCVLLAAAASHVLPPGQYDRRDDPATGRKVVVAGTYHAVAARPVGPFQALVAIPRGMADAAAVIFFVFLIGGAFTVVDETGALRPGVDWLVRRFGHSEALVVPAASLAFAALGVGVLRCGWGFNEMAALFFAMGGVAGLVGGLGLGGTADALVAGFRSMAYAALLIGFARAIFATLEEGRIVDTIVHGLFAPLTQLPLALAALGMMAVHGLVHVPVPSPSGHAVLTLPILVPLADLLGLSRQVTVLAYQYGGGLCELFTPTNGALLAILAAAQVRYEDWLRFALPLLL